MPLISFLFTVVLSYATFANALTVRPLPLEKEISVISGDTGKDLESVLPIKGQFTHPQAIYSFTVPPNGGVDADVRFSTCVPADDNSLQYNLVSPVIFVLDSLYIPEGGSLRITPVAASVPDCGGKFSTLDFRAPVGVPFFLVVSSTAGHGTGFRLETSITASPPKPTTLPWGLDRIDQRILPLDKKYSVTGLSGKKVYVYVLDSGVRVTHSEFKRPNGESNAIHGADMVDRLDYATDCTGHGTHVAAKIGGNSTGVAKDAIIVSVRVTGCNGAGITSRVLEGLKFVLKDSEQKNRRPAVVTMSLSTVKSDEVNKAVKTLSDEGIPVVTAAGNSDEDSCNFSPSSEKTSITVAASNRDDSRPQFSNSGVCVDMFAPGQDIISAWHTGDHAYSVRSGTSFACPHVAGAVAILLSVNPTLPSEALANMIYSAATFKKVANHSVSTQLTRSSGEASHLEELNNRLLYVRPIPSLSLERPKKDYMYIYAALSISTGTTCSEAWLEFEDRKKETSAVLSSLAESNSEDVNFWTCCPNSPQNQKRCGTSNFTSTRVFTQLRTPERQASATFKTLEAGLRDPGSLSALRSSFESSAVSVVIEPWVVDSDGNVFWTAPDLRADKRGWLSTGVLIAIIMCSCALLVAAAVGALTYFRNSREAKAEAERQYEIARHLETKAAQDAIQPMDKIFDPGSPREYMGFMRENSALDGDALLNLSSNASLRTPQASRSNLSSSRSLRSTRSALNSFAENLRHPFTSRQDSTAGFDAGDATPQRGGADDMFRKRTTEINRAWGSTGPKTPRKTGGGEQERGTYRDDVSPGTEALAETPRNAGGLAKGVSFFGHAVSFRFGGKADVEEKEARGGKAPNSPSHQQTTKEERESARKNIETSRPFRPVQALAPNILQSMGEGSGETVSTPTWSTADDAAFEDAEEDSKDATK